MILSKDFFLLCTGVTMLPSMPMLFSLFLSCASKNPTSSPTSSPPPDRPLGAGASKVAECTQSSECHAKHSNPESTCVDDFCYIASDVAPDREAYTELPFSQMKVKNTAYPRKSIAMETLQLKESLCNIRFFIDEQGSTTEFDLSECPLFFHPAVQEVGPHWRFEPTVNEAGEGIKVTTVLKIVVQ